MKLSSFVFISRIPYLSEKICSPDQKIIKKADGKIRLIFSSSSEFELKGWVLSFADEARVVKPKWYSDDNSSIRIKFKENIYFDIQRKVYPKLAT